jgi:exoribonuclease-2
MEPGRVIEFIEGRSFLTAVVTRVKSNKVLVLSENDREMSISSGRIMHETHYGLDLTQPRHELVKKLQEISRHRSELSSKLDLVELWELLEGEGEEFSYEFLAELAWPGSVAGDQAAAALRSVFSDGIYFRMRPDTAVRHSAEKVEQMTTVRIRDQEREKELAEGSDWLSKVWYDECGQEPGCRDRVVKILHDMALYNSNAPELKWGKQLLERADLGSDHLLPFKLLVKIGEMNVHENLDLIREGLPVCFSAEVLSEAEVVARDTTWQQEPRRDLTHLEVITADSGGAKDFDDAVSLDLNGDHLLLGVHIADVSAVVKPDSLLDREAMGRTTSIYMPDRRIPMLPEVLSEERLSLKEKEVRPAFSMLAELTESGEVSHYEFVPSLLTVKRQLSYQDVDAAVGHDLLLGRMFQLSKSLKAKRIAQGALILPMPKLNVFLTPDGEIGVNLTLWDNPGRSMISEFMILANHLAARYLYERGEPCFYRQQNEPSERIVTPETTCDDLYTCLKQRRFISRVNWGLEPLPHSGMGLALYTNLTSPLRRYIDLVIQRQIRALSRGGAALYSEEQMNEILTYVEGLRKRALRVQNLRRRYWLLLYLAGRIGQEHEALVLERHPHRWRIFLTDLMMDADLPVRHGQTLELGQTINIKIKHVDPRNDILKFELV